MAPKAYSPRYLFCIFFLDCWFKRKRSLVCFDLIYETLFYRPNYFGNFSYNTKYGNILQKTGSLANSKVNCIGFYWYKFNKLWKHYKMLENILEFLRLTFFQSVFLLQIKTNQGPLSLKSTIKEKYAEEISQWIRFSNYFKDLT